MTLMTGFVLQGHVCITMLLLKTQRSTNMNPELQLPVCVTDDSINDCLKEIMTEKHSRPTVNDESKTQMKCVAKSSHKRESCAYR